MKKIMLYCIAIVALIIGVYLLYPVYYNYPRTVSFELVKEIDKPYSEFDRTYYVGFDYVENEEVLMRFMIDFYQRDICIERGLMGYDSIFVKNLGKELDFKKYDYLITYQKQLRALNHSPYLSKTEDLLWHDKKTPLIPTFDTIITDKVYIYRIKKNNRYRAPGP
jgi:hypothetical protein